MIFSEDYILGLSYFITSVKSQRRDEQVKDPPGENVFKNFTFLKNSIGLRLV